MATVTKFEELEVWQLTRQFAKEIHETIKACEHFEKDFRLKDQINGAAGSIMDNIAEGFERNGRREFIQFLSIAKGSAGEVKSQLYRALDKAYLTKEKFDYLYLKADELGRKIGGFMSYLNNTEFKGTKFKPNTP